GLLMLPAFRVRRSHTLLNGGDFGLRLRQGDFRAQPANYGVEIVKPAPGFLLCSQAGRHPDVRSWKSGQLILTAEIIPVRIGEVLGHDSNYPVRLAVYVNRAAQDV